jgi:hypothetical protein
MSKISLEGNSLGSGTFTIAAPNSNTSYTLTLPENTGTVVTTGGASSLTTSGNLTFTGTGNRITGDMSNATQTNRLAFQTSTANSATGVNLLPNGTSSISTLICYGNSDPTNAPRIRIASEGGNGFNAIYSDISGTGTYLPMLFFAGGSERMRIDTSGNVGIGTSSPSSSSKQTIQFEAGGSLSGAMSLIAYGGSPTIGFRQASGTIASPGASNTAVINLIGGSTSDGTNFFNTLAIQGIMESTATSGSHPTLILFATTPSGSTSRLERMRIASNGTITFNAYGAGTLSTNASGVVSASDGRYKTKTRSIDTALPVIQSLKPTYFRWNEDSPFASEHEELGFFAQEVAQSIPEASPGEDEEGKYRNYHDRAILAMLVKAIQELKAELDEAKARIATLEAGA